MDSSKRAEGEINFPGLRKLLGEQIDSDRGGISKKDAKLILSLFNVAEAAMAYAKFPDGTTMELKSPQEEEKLTQVWKAKERARRDLIRIAREATTAS